MSNKGLPFKGLFSCGTLSQSIRAPPDEISPYEFLLSSLIILFKARIYIHIYKPMIYNQQGIIKYTSYNILILRLKKIYRCEYRVLIYNLITPYNTGS